MLELLQFATSGFWVFVGCFLLLWLAGWAVFWALFWGCVGIAAWRGTKL